MTTQLVVPITNPVTFKNCQNVTIKNKWNTLHDNSAIGNFGLIPYCQPVNSGSELPFHFLSTSNEVPVLKAYNKTTGALIETITCVLANSIVGDYTRHYFNASTTAGASYLNKKVFFIVTQGSDVWTSEPIYTSDLTADIARGTVHKVEYANIRTNENPLIGFGVDWENIPVELFHVWVEGQLIEMSGKDESELLEGSQSTSLISATVYSGDMFAIQAVPKYMYEKLKAISVLDYFFVDGIQYIRNGEVEQTRFGGSTSFELKLNLIEKNALGINVDNLGVTIDEEAMADYTSSHLNMTTDFTVPIPDGYDVHYIKATHSASSSGNDATLTAGYTLGGEDLINSANGVITSSEAVSYTVHANKEGGTLYFGISGTSVLLDIKIRFTVI